MHVLIFIGDNERAELGPLFRAPVNAPAQFCEQSTAAKTRFKNLLHRPIILNSPLYLCERIFRG